MKPTAKNIAAIMKEHGYKLTPQRRAIIRAISANQEHLTPAAIYEQVHGIHPGIGLVTIYRTLDILAGLGLVCELHAGGSCRSYTVSGFGHHYHLICSGCGTVVDFSGHDLSPLEQRLARETGFEIEDHLLEFTGVCTACQKEYASQETPLPA